MSITKMSDTCTLSQLSPMSLTTVSVSPRWVIPVLYHSYHLCLLLYCISITKMSDTCTLSQLSPMSLTVLYQYHQDEWYLYSITVIIYVSDCTVSISPRWVLPVLYHSYRLCLWLLYQYHQDEWYLYSITVITYVSDCTISVSPRWVIPLLYHSYHLSLTTVSVSPRWVIPVLYHSYHLCLWLYCISITKMSDTCTLSQLSPMSLTVLYQYHQDEWYLYSITVITYVSDYTVTVSPRWVIPVLYHS